MSGNNLHLDLSYSLVYFHIIKDDNERKLKDRDMKLILVFNTRHFGVFMTNK